MFLNHIALVCSSENNSDRFYQGVLGLKKMQSKVVAADLSEKIFNLNRSYPLVNYANEHLKFEIFISEQKDIEDRRISHVCLEVGNMEIFLAKCTEMNVEIIRIPKGESVYIFVRDYDGNLFEIKEKKGE
ncbi:MAG: hypothetical protein BWK80_58380 [Desulfobacteraceae bacterium IS3]|nr:MAG: hypothetical protein BWK80_58380 [Desulfobacteraceae bacterium IS3]